MPEHRSVPAGKFLIVCDLPGCDRQVVKRVRWSGGAADGITYAFSFTAGGVRLGTDQQSAGAGWTHGRSRWAFECRRCGDRVEARGEKFGELLERLTAAGVSEISLTALRATLF